MREEHMTKSTTAQELIAEVKALKKENAKLTQRLNRIKKLTPGKDRIWRLDTFAMYADMDADAATTDEERKMAKSDVLFLHRFEWDILRLNETVHDKPTRNGLGGQTSHPDYWKGERP